MPRAGHLIRFCVPVGACSLLLSVAMASVACAESGAPTDPAEAKAYAVLERHCARCHQQGRLEGRTTPAGKFGNVLRLAELAHEGRLVIGGNPDGSRLWTHMMRRMMPFDVYQEPSGRPGPDAEEILAVRDWIAQAVTPRARNAATPERRADAVRQATFEPRLTFAADKSTYAAGDAVTLRVSANVDCRVTLVSVDTHGRGTVLLPNELTPANELAANQELTVPAPDAGYLFRVNESGTERIIALCAMGLGAADGIRHDFERQRFTDLGDYRAFLAKAIAGEAEPAPVAKKPEERPSRRKRRVRRARPAPAPPPPEPFAVPQSVLRAGIVLEVR